MADMDSMIRNCPLCGKDTAAVYRNARAFGWVQEVAYSKKTIEFDTDGLSFTRSRKIRCTECHRVRRDLTWGDHGPQVKAAEAEDAGQ